MVVRARGYTIDAAAGVVIGRRGRPVGSLDSSGYIQVDARSRGLGMISAHRLIWEGVHGPIPPGLEVNHINGDKADNRIANLELVTHQQNVQHAYDTGLKSNRGEKHPSRKLDDRAVVEIRRVGRTIPSRELAARFGVSSRCVRDVLAGRTWAHVKEVTPCP